MCYVPRTAASVQNLLNAFQIFVQPFSYISSGPNDYGYDEAFHIPHTLNFYTYIFVF